MTCSLHVEYSQHACVVPEQSGNTKMGNGPQDEPLCTINSQCKQKLVSVQDYSFCGHIITMKILHLLCILNSNGLSEVLNM